MKCPRFRKLTLTIERTPNLEWEKHPGEVSIHCQIASQQAEVFNAHDHLHAWEVDGFDFAATASRILATVETAIRNALDNGLPPPPVQRIKPNPEAWTSFVVEQALLAANLHPTQCFKCKHLRAGDKPNTLPRCGAEPANPKKANPQGNCPDYFPQGVDWQIR